jgi:serine/threonine protein kinase
MNGGSLCKTSETHRSLDPDVRDVGDIYTLGEDLGGYDTIFVDANDETKVIKFFSTYNSNCKNEAHILKKLNDTGVTPKYYGVYACNESNKPTYVVMERIMGYDLLYLLEQHISQERSRNPAIKKEMITIQFVERYLDEIYEIYNKLLDLGVIQNDLYLQNIILNNDDGKLYFIDFEYSIDVGEPIPIEYRVSKEQLLENLVNRKPIHKLNTYATETRGLGKGKGKGKTQKIARRSRNKRKRTRRRRTVL